jgi:hypothetical protein
VTATSMCISRPLPKNHQSKNGNGGNPQRLPEFRVSKSQRWDVRAMAIKQQLYVPVWQVKGAILLMLATGIIIICTLG